MLTSNAKSTIITVLIVTNFILFGIVNLLGFKFRYSWPWLSNSSLESLDAHLSIYRYEQSMLYPENVIFRVIPTTNISTSSTSYSIYWKSFEIGNKMQNVSFPSITTDLNKWAINYDERKTFIILYGDSNERKALQNVYEYHPNLNCKWLRESQLCCDVQQELETTNYTINVTFCNVFAFTVNPNQSMNSDNHYNFRKIAENSNDVNFKQRINASIKSWNQHYNINLANKCSSKEWNCHILFQSFLWDILSDLHKMDSYEQNLLTLYNYIKDDGFNFINKENIIWRDAPIPAPWSLKDRSRDNDINELSAYNQIGFNLFAEKMKNGEMKIFKWSNYMPLANHAGGDDHHWHRIFNELYLGLIYRFTTL